MDEIQLQAIGREFLKLVTQAEQMFMENRALRSRIDELEKAAEAPKPNV